MHLILYLYHSNLLVHNDLLNYVTTEFSKLCFKSIVGDAVVACYGLDEQCLTLQDEGTRKKQCNSHLLGK